MMNFGMNGAGDFANSVGNVQKKMKYGSSCQFFQIEYVASFVNFATLPILPSGA